MEAEDLAQVSESLRRAVQGGEPDDVRRAVEDFGWHELLDEEAQAAVGTLLALQGELLLPVTFLDDVLVAAAGLQLPKGVRVVLPRMGGLDPTSRLARPRVEIAGVAQAGEEGTALVPCVDDDGAVALVTATISTPADAARTIDPDAGWVAVEATVSLDEVLLEGEDAVRAWRRMQTVGRRALAHELVAIGGEMLRLTVEHVATREQFGQALGSFQAVKHKLADVRLWQEVATLSVDAAWEDDDEDSAALAKAAACRFTRTAREHCQQLLGGMGFTWEHAFHTYLRRALTLEPLLGSAATQHELLGEALRGRGVSRNLAAL